MKKFSLVFCAVVSALAVTLSAQAEDMFGNSIITTTTPSEDGTEYYTSTTDMTGACPPVVLAEVDRIVDELKPASNAASQYALEWQEITNGVDYENCLSVKTKRESLKAERQRLWTRLYGGREPTDTKKHLADEVKTLNDQLEALEKEHDRCRVIIAEEETALKKYNNFLKIVNDHSARLEELYKEYPTCEHSEMTIEMIREWRETQSPGGSQSF